MTPVIPKISLKAARINAGLTQEEAAEKIGITAWQLWSWEKDPGEVKIKYVPKIAEVYDYPRDLILFE